MDILRLGLGPGLGLGRVLGLELGSQDVPGFKNTGVNFLASGRSRQNVADPIFLQRSIVLQLTDPTLLHVTPGLILYGSTMDICQKGIHQVLQCCKRSCVVS